MSGKTEYTVVRLDDPRLGDFKEGFSPSDINYISVVVRQDKYGILEVIGYDGGEPEDQTLRRDWSWVAPALQRAYNLGKAHGRVMTHEDYL